MSSFKERMENERRHLIEGPAPQEKPTGLGTVRFIGSTSEDAEQVIERTRAVLIAVNQASICGWPPDHAWCALLPGWFVMSCGPELSPKEAEAEMARRKTLPPEEQKRAAEEGWSLLNWIYWFQPDNRFWYWWDAKALDDGVLVVAVEAYEWPFPSDALIWLLRAAGAERVDVEE